MRAKVFLVKNSHKWSTNLYTSLYIRFNQQVWVDPADCLGVERKTRDSPLDRNGSFEANPFLQGIGELASTRKKELSLPEKTREQGGETLSQR